MAFVYEYRYITKMIEYLSVFSLVLQGGVFTFDVLVGCIVDKIVGDLTIKCNWS